MNSIRDIWCDKPVRNMLLISLLLASFFVFLYIYFTEASLMKVFLTYLKELGFAVLVALPILITIEMFNQKRHAAIEQNLLKEQAVALIKNGVPDKIWSCIDSSLIQASFYRTESNVVYTLSLEKNEHGAEYVDVLVNISYIAKRIRQDNSRLKMTASIAITDDSAGCARFNHFRVGTKTYKKAELANMTEVINGNLVVTDIPDQDIQLDMSLVVNIELATAFSLLNPFEAFILNIPSTDLTITVNASDELDVQLDTLHPIDMREVMTTIPNQKIWSQPCGLLAGSGAIIRWRKRDLPGIPPSSELVQV